MSFKKCNCDECEGYHEGYCIMDIIYSGFNPDDCDAKSNSDLMTKDEYIKKFGNHPNFGRID